MQVSVNVKIDCGRFALQCPGYIVKAALGKIRGDRVQLLETYGTNVRI